MMKKKQTGFGRRIGQKVGKFLSTRTQILIILALIALLSFTSSLKFKSTFRLHELAETSRSTSLADPTITDSFEIEQNFIDNNVYSEEDDHSLNLSISSPDSYQNLEIWRKPNSENYRKCIDRKEKEKEKVEVHATDGYLIPHANGGLNQMSLGISDMVAIAKTMNASFILPSLDHTSFWKDSSEFKDIYNVENFIEVLKDDIPVLESLPPEFAKLEPYEMAPVTLSKLSYYRDKNKLLKRHKVIKFTHSDNRLANNVAGAMQRLRCRVLYKALRFRKEIEDLGMKLVKRIKTSSGDPFIALHLRYEKDMLAFTGCSHNLTETEHQELKNMRYNIPHWKEKIIDGEKRRLQGQCPMTPREVAVFLEALGYPPNTKIYLVGGQIFGQQGIAPLEQKFPNLFSKTTLSTEEELAPFKNFLNQMAALDYVVSLHSDVFVYSFDGNMAKALQGHRRFEGFRKTISPDRKMFVKEFDKLEEGLISKETLFSKVKSSHENRIGAPILRQVLQSSRKLGKKEEENFYSNPYPGCICEETARSF